MTLRAVCPDRQFGQQTADQLPWFHIVTLPTIEALEEELSRDLEQEDQP